MAVRAFVRPLAFAGALVATSLAGIAAHPAAAAPKPDACTQALAYEKTAAQDSVSAQGRYDSAVAGLAINARCSDPQMHLVNEGYLLSMRAPAEHELHVGDWQRDLTRANMLLTQCSGWPGLKNKPAGENCSTQIRYNAIVAKNFSQPTPAPAAASPAAAGASPAPRASGAPAPRLGPAVAPPTPPAPSATAAPHR